MSDNSHIEWTDATWNPVRGCSRVSPGCGGPNHEGGCYAERIAARFSDPGQPFHGFAERTPHGGRWTGKLALIEDQLTLPLRWKRPRKIFVNSMSDLFHESLPDEAIDKVFAVMALCPQHTFQVLTKRAERMREYFADNRVGGDPPDTGWLPGARASWGIRDTLSHLPIEEMNLTDGQWSLYEDTAAIDLPLPNVWLGVSAEDQERADERIPLLLDTPAAVRFVSLEPLLGAIDLRSWLYESEACGNCGDGSFYEGRRRCCDEPLPATQHSLDWVIVGGESGPNARPMYPAWARSLRDQCQAAGVAFFFKQWGEWVTDDGWPGERHRIGKKAAGRLLDGTEHNAFPLTATPSNLRSSA